MTARAPLQNHLGDRRWPVRGERRWQRLMPALRNEADPRGQARRDVLWLGVAGVVGAVVVGLLFAAAVPPERATPTGPWYVGGFTGLLLGATAMQVAAFFDRSRPGREQRRWLRLARPGALTDEQQSLVALGLVQDWAEGAWSATLPHRACWARLPETHRRRWADGAGRHPFLALRPVAPLAVRIALDEDVRVVTADDLRLFVLDGLQDGAWSRALGEALEDDERVRRLAGLLGVPADRVRALGEAEPAPLLRAADVQHVVRVVRDAFACDLVDEAEAWRLLRLAGDAAAAAYDGWDDYRFALRVAHALSTDSLTEVDLLADRLDRLPASRWPAARAAFPRRA